jgi:dTDP-4-dehydrorhamnose 3,5-epimerase-like enzyme
MDINDCKFINLPKIEDSRGSISFIEGNNHIPMALKRLYYIYDVPAGSKRGCHAHTDNYELIIAISGSFDVLIDNGKSKKKFHLNRPHIGLFVPPMFWRELENFSSESVCLVAASLEYDEGDYYRDYNDFLKAVES